MSYAIAMSDQKLAHHFSKADIFSFYDDNHRKIAVYKNPALGMKGCAGKQTIINLFKQRQCHTVIVRKIGEKTLARLLDSGFDVIQGNTRHDITTVLEEASLKIHPLTDASQGVANNAPCCGKHA
ncbi:hypothetical protein CW745_10060 [Psychromonas sp. psych-6C06]|uniref:NifB/NifX family molybdenum-iron cluster-binding protein n=1 Tax=Psychromonas sp. psych-6C06 TaxID=2058089 RepID=UPI000C321998|nr:NifB/NifX family molybdenum-iron cluster-binding protein [Psychromonas sp. psych-6C06]PKF61660.1 hypothetical protein CW745_10060 [Psychromonas sp. psych-6C06]